MTPDSADTSQYIGTADSDTHVSESAGRCAICGSTKSLSQYSLTNASESRSIIDLCPSHHRVAATLGAAPQTGTAKSADYDLQETQKITVRVPKALVDGADTAAEQYGQTRSEFVRDALQKSLEIQDMTESFDEILAQAVHTDGNTDTGQSESTEADEADVEFLKERIRKLETLLEESINKI
jgi:Arc/MetJ-type ribon-helix-helix transcriptional regulator